MRIAFLLMSLAGLLATEVADAQALAWVFENISPGTTSTISAISLDMDDLGAPHIAFGARTPGAPAQCGFYLKYATKTGGAWTVTVADSIGLQMSRVYSAIATDVDRLPHIAYTHSDGDCFSGSDKLRHARNTGSAWIVEVVDSSTFILADVATDPGESVHVVYSSKKYAVKSGGSWTIEAISGVVGGQPALALHGAGAEIHAAFATGIAQANDTWYAVRRTGTWTVENLGRPSLNCDIAVDDGGQPHIAWWRSDTASDSVLYATKSGGAWVIEAVDAHAGSPKIQLDEDGNPHLLFDDPTPGAPDAVKYARKSGGAWQIEVVDADSVAISAGGVGFDLDASGRPHFAYRRSALGGFTIRYATLDPATSVSPASGVDPIRLTVVPNPARIGDARILYRAPIDGLFDLDIYDTSGRRVRSLAAGSLAHASGSAAWDGRDDAGRLVGTGTYLVRLSLGSQVSRSAKLVLVR